VTVLVRATEGFALKRGIKIAVGGKGGVGKTTISAILAQLFAEDGIDVMAVDADPDTNLCNAFGIDAERAPEPLIKMKALISERTGTDKAAVGAYFKLNPDVSDLPEKYCLKLNSLNKGGVFPESLKLFILGAITQAGSGCACAEGAFLKAFLAHTLLHRQEMILVDLAAGVEFLGRSSIQGIDVLIVVVEPGSRSIETGANIAQMGRDLGVKHVAYIINKVTQPQQVEAIKSQLKDLIHLVSINYMSEVQQADMHREGVYPACTELVGRLREAKNVLNELTKSSVD
jgi:CO dehydrogenase maturation factor